MDCKIDLGNYIFDFLGRPRGFPVARCIRYHAACREMPSRFARTATSEGFRPGGLSGFLMYLRVMGFAALRSGPRYHPRRSSTPEWGVVEIKES